MNDNMTLVDETHEQALWASGGGLEASYLGGELPQILAEDSRSAAALPEPDPSLLVRQAGLPREIRALWVTRWDYRTAADIRRIAERASSANFNALFFQVRGNADAYYTSQIEPWAARLRWNVGAKPWLGSPGSRSERGTRSRA